MRDNPSAIRVWLILWKAARAVERTAVRSVAGLGLGLSDFAALEMLLHKGPQPIQVIGRKVLLTSSSITAAVNRLEARGLVRRSRDPNDARSRIAELTPEGKRLIQTAFEQHTCDIEGAMAVLSPAERAELIRLLKKLGIWADARLESEDAAKRAG